MSIHCFRITFKRHHFVVFSIHLLHLLIAFHLLLPIFYNLQPSWTCNDEISGADPSRNRNCTILSNCPEANLTFRAPFYSMVQDLRMLCGQEKYYASLISTLLYAGVLVGAVIFGQLSDTFGRKMILLFLLTSTTIFGSACALAQSWIVLGIIRSVVWSISWRFNDCTFRLRHGVDCGENLFSKPSRRYVGLGAGNLKR